MFVVGDVDLGFVLSFQNPQVVRLLGVCTKERPIMLIMELMDRGSLKELLRHSKPTAEGVLEFLPEEMSRMGLDIANGMDFLSSKGFIHRDLAARFVICSQYEQTRFLLCLTSNCLVDSDYVVKISDFGMSRDLNTHGFHQSALFTY